MSSPLRKCKVLYLKISGDGFGLNLTSFRATISLCSILSSLKKQQMRNSWT